MNGAPGVSHVTCSHIALSICMHRGSNMSAHVLLNLLNKLWKRDKMRSYEGHPIKNETFSIAQ